MIKILLNERTIEIEDNISIYDLRVRFNPYADVVIHNGYIANDKDMLIDNDSVTIIKKGVIPSYQELEYMMISRHTPKVYDTLKASSIAIIGVGGLGSNASISLARMGVGRIKIIDFDIVEPSNLNRQFYFINQIGQNKVDALFETLKNINPYIEIIKSDKKIDKENFIDELIGYDVIIEAVDIAETKAFIFRYGLKHTDNNIIIGASGIAGIYDTSLIEIKYLNRRAIVVGDFVNEAKKGEGLMATRAAVVANIQANLAVRYLLGEVDSDNNKA